MACLWDLPPEVLDRMLAELDPLDVAAFSQTSKLARDHVYTASDTHLWREIYLKNFDDPRSYVPSMGRDGEVEGGEAISAFDWQGSVKRRTKVKGVLVAPSTPTFLARLEKWFPGSQKLHIYGILHDLLDTSDDSITSRNIAFLKDLLAPVHVQSFLLHCRGYSDIEQPVLSERRNNGALVAAAAKFHTRYGLTQLDLTQPEFRTYARQAVYLVQNFKEHTMYGPFHADGSGRVNWSCMEALMTVLGVNLHQARASAMAGDAQSLAATGTALPLAARPWTDMPIPMLDGMQTAKKGTQPRTEGFPEVPGDWAGVTGRWRRAVAFLDYRDLHLYNFSGQPANLQDFTEALRLMTLELRIVAIGNPVHGRDVIPMNLCSADPAFPPLFFHGTSASTMFSHPISKIRGCVSKTVDGQVRWTLLSTYGGEDRWASEGIQVGGEKSAWGSVGVWSDVDRGDAEAPSGPFYLFKVA